MKKGCRNENGNMEMLVPGDSAMNGWNEVQTEWLSVFDEVGSEFLTQK